MERIAENQSCLKTLEECKKCGQFEAIGSSHYGSKNYYCRGK